MMRDYEPESGYNLPAGCLEVPEPEARTCATCRHCIEECCDMGICDVKLKSEPQDFDSWMDVVDHMEDARVDMQVDSCAYWKEC